MTTLPSNITPAKAPAPQTRAEADLLARYQNAVEMTAAGLSSISDQRAPDGDDRRALLARRGELTASLTASDPRDVVKRVARLFMRFPSTRLPEGHAEAVMAAYAADLASFPLWAIDKAFLAVIAGQRRCVESVCAVLDRTAQSLRKGDAAVCTKNWPT
jgi:hypothetical protein